MLGPSNIEIVPITLDKERKMMMDWGVVFLIEQQLTLRHGERTEHGAQQWVSIQSLGDVTKSSVADLITLVWGALYRDDETITEKDVGRMVHFKNQEYVCEKLAEAMGQLGELDETDPLVESENGDGDLKTAGG